jgi:hypothetical protein
MSLVYLVVGGTLLLATFSRLVAFGLPGFYFMQLYGFVGMMIFGLSYLFVPSFAHTFLHSLKLAKLQFWIMNFGIVGLTVSFSGLFPYTETLKPLTVGSLSLLVLALYLHAYNLWWTMRAWKGSPGESLAKEVSANPGGS